MSADFSERAMQPFVRSCCSRTEFVSIHSNIKHEAGSEQGRWMNIVSIWLRSGHLTDSVQDNDGLSPRVLITPLVKLTVA